jgi:organic radical activating enzyme
MPEQRRSGPGGPAQGDGGGYLAGRLAAQSRTGDLTPTPPFPRALMLELSNACNHTCAFCYNPDMTRRRRTMDPAFTERVLADAHALGAREVGFATTGEPLANRRLLDYVAAAKRLGYEYTYFSTNGALLDADKVERIFTAGLDSIKFSINAGTAVTYAKVHGQDCFDHVVAMVHLIARRRRELGRDLKLLATSILTAENSHEQDALREALGGAVDDLQFFAETKAVGPTNGTSAPLPCAMVFNRVHVTCEGYLTACCVDYENNLVGADLNATPLAEAWHSAAFAELRRRHLDKKLKGTLCQVCVSRKMSDYLPLTDIGRAGAPALVKTAAAVDAAEPPRRDVVVHFSSSLGEIDWLLPVLHRLHQKRPEARIVACVEARQLQRKLVDAAFLRGKLAEVATIVRHGDDDLAAHVRPADVALLLKTYDPDNAFSRSLRARFPAAKVVLFPSGTALLTRRDDPVSLVDAYYASIIPHVGRDPREDHLPCDLVLAGSPHMEPYYAAVANATSIHAGGVPRYDAWWIDAQRADPDLAGAAERTFVERHARSVLFVIRGPHWLYQAEDDYRQLMAAFLAETKRRPDTAFLVKPHPRQDPEQVAALLRAVGGPNVALSFRPLQQLSGMVDLVVSMFSSGVLDALSVGTPVVEFYRYHQRQPVLEFRTGADGRPVSIYQDLGLVENLAGPAALAACLDALERGETAAIDPRRQGAFRAACTVAPDASAAAADALITLLTTADVKEMVHA